MHRRAFVRLVGGGAVAAAALPLAGMRQRLPGRGAGGLAGAGRRRPTCGAGSSATPSWRRTRTTCSRGWWTCARRARSCCAATCTRLLPETDPYSRQIMMSQGTFLELLDLAARERGQRAEITLFPEGEFGPDKPDDAPGGAHPARDRRRGEQGPAVRADPQAPHQPQRLRPGSARCRRRPGRPWPTRCSRTRCASASSAPTSPTRCEQHRAIADEAWRIELTTPRSHPGVVQGAARRRRRDRAAPRRPVADRPDGGLDGPPGPVRPQPGAGPDDFATTSQIKDFGKKIASTPGFLWMVTEGNDRVTQVNAGRAYARVQLAATAQGVVMQPLQQALQEYPEQARALRGHPPPARAPPRRRRRCRCGRASASRRPCSRRRAAAWRLTSWPADARGRRPRADAAAPHRRARATARPPRRASSAPWARCWRATASAPSASMPSPARPAWTRC